MYLSAVVLIPNTLPLSEDPYTTTAEFVSAALWDITSSLDPIFMTDALNWIFGLGQ